MTAVMIIASICEGTVLTGTLRSRAAENTGDQADSNDELQKLPIGLCPVEVEHIFSTIFGSISCKVWLSAEILVKGHPIRADGKHCTYDPSLQFITPYYTLHRGAVK